MRLLLVGAFPYPQNHGSQIYFQEQAIALRSLGAEVSLLTYGAGRKLLRDTVRKAHDGDPSGQETKGPTTQEIEMAEYFRALDGFEHRVSAKWTAPSSLRSGPSWQKPLADFGLAMTLRNAIASRSRHNAFDAILTHNAEATLTALQMLPRRRPPIIYCAHTLLGRELSAYLKSLKLNGYSETSKPTRSRRTALWTLDRIGAGIDRSIARKVDGWIVLTRSTERVMRHFSDAPGTLIPPAVPDPLLDARALDPRTTARAHGLEPGRFFLYSGNLDAYQELDTLAAASKRREAGAEACTGRGMRLVIASHSSPSTPDWPDNTRGMKFLQVDSSAEMQALLASARASLLMRRAEGGFPIKLVNSLAVGTPAIAFRGAEWGLEHEHNSLICSLEQPISSMTAAIDRLESQNELSARLAAGARALYLERHQPEPTARQTLALIEEVCQRHSSR